MRIDTVMQSLFLLDWADRNYDKRSSLQDRYGRPISSRDVIRKFIPILEGTDKVLHVTSANDRVKYLVVERLIKKSNKSYWGEKAAVNIYELSSLGQAYFQKHYKGFEMAFSEGIKKFK
jgi:hypothetical protein